ncbi:unnamed protein product [Merluccius merluccius]
MSPMRSGVLLALLCALRGAAARCPQTAYYQGCWIRRVPGLSADPDRRGGALLLRTYREDTALKCSRTCCLTRNFSCNLAVFHYDTGQENANCQHLHCPTPESCVLTRRGSVVLFNITKGVDPDLLVFGKYFTSNVRVLPHLYTRTNASEPLASDKRQFNRPPRPPAQHVTPAPSGKMRTSTSRTVGTGQPTTFPTTLSSPSERPDLGTTPDPSTDGPQAQSQVESKAQVQSQAPQPVPGTPATPLTPTITTTTTTTHVFLDQTDQTPQTDYKDLFAESAQASSVSAKRYTTSSPPHPTPTTPPSPQHGADTPAAVSDPSHATMTTTTTTPPMTTSAASTSAALLANMESGSQQHATANEATGHSHGGGDHTDPPGPGEGAPWINGAGDDEPGTAWHAAAHTVLVAVAACATVLLSCCCSVVLAVSWRSRRKRKGRYRTTWRGKVGSMRLIKYVLIREGS